METPSPTTLRATRLFLLVIAGCWSGQAAALDLSDNFTSATGGVELASGPRWLAASFATDGAASYQLESVTLLLSSAEPATAALDLHSDSGLEPGSPLATLEPPGSFSTDPSPATFNANGVTLEPNTTYWVVLRALDGTIEWSWTAANMGSGAGFLTTWDVSEEAGAAWHTHDVYPLQLRVTASTGEPITDCNGNGLPDDADIREGRSPDCDASGVPDSCELASGALADVNANGLPDDCETGFLRGDSNCDGDTDISDAVRTLEYLFAGSPGPCCGDAADANDDGELDISDPVGALNFLFQGGVAPPAPGPDLPCGVDPSSDGIDGVLPCDYPAEACVAAPAGG